MWAFCTIYSSRNYVKISLLLTKRWVNLVTFCPSGGHPAHRASGGQHPDDPTLHWEQERDGLFQTQLQKHLLHHNAALQVHHRHGWHGVHRGLPVQGDLLRAPHLLHHPYLHPSAQHAHRPDEPHRGADNPGEHQHLGAAGTGRGGAVVFWQDLFSQSDWRGARRCLQRAITILDMERRMPCCLKKALRCGVKRKLGTALGEDHRWCFRFACSTATWHCWLAEFVVVVCSCFTVLCHSRRDFYSIK